MIRDAPRQHFGLQAFHPPQEAAVEPQRYNSAHAMRGNAGPNIREARQERRTDHIAISQYCSALGHLPRDPMKLPPVKQLTMRQMHVRHGKPLAFEYLTDTADDKPALQSQPAFAHGKAVRAPGGETMMPAG